MSAHNRGTPKRVRDTESRNDGAATPLKPAKMMKLDAASPETELFEASGTHVPTAVIKRVQQLDGASVTRGQGLTHMEFYDRNGAARKYFVEWMQSLGDNEDPLVSVAQPLSSAVDREVHAIVHHYQSLRAPDFHLALPGLPQLPAPQRVYPALIRMNGIMAMIAVASRVGMPQSPLYPAINAVPSGERLCVLHFHWARGTVTSEHIFRL